jgi:uncharacterized protein (DUF302 family)
MKPLLVAVALSAGLALSGPVTSLAEEAAKTPTPSQAPATKEADAKAAVGPDIQMFDINHSVLKMGLMPGVTADAAAQAMQSKAAELNMKLVGYQNVGEEVRNRGTDAPRLEIFQFCDPDDAVKMVKFNPIYAAYMPCRIALVEDNAGKVWLEMLNLDMIISAYPLPPELQAIAINVNGIMLDIITAGSTGEF